MSKTWLAAFTMGLNYRFWGCHKCDCPFTRAPWRETFMLGFARDGGTEHGT